VNLDAARRAWIEETLGSRVVDATRIGDGASRASWLVDLGPDGCVVLREETGSGPMVGTPLDLAREAHVYRSLQDEDVPIPTLLAVNPAGDALLLERVDGDASLKGLSAAQVASLSRGLGQALATLHSVDPASLQLGPIPLPHNPPDHARQEVELWAGIAAARVVHPATRVADVAFDWLRTRAPTRVVKTSLCHGDAGAGNFLHDGAVVTALLDWEFAHVGDPHDDLAWVAVRNEVLRRPLDLGVVYGAWQEAVGLAIEPAVLEYYRALVLTRMLISCDAALTYAGDEPPKVQSMLRPYLGLAVVEALRRAGNPPSGLNELESEARAQWETAPIARVLDDPAKSVDLGGPW
jgi:aminoglycoside phosphotransferase (APT) family kinase protein